MFRIKISTGAYLPFFAGKRKVSEDKGKKEDEYKEDIKVKEDIKEEEAAAKKSQDKNSCQSKHSCLKGKCEQNFYKTKLCKKKEKHCVRLNIIQKSPLYMLMILVF